MGLTIHYSLRSTVRSPKQARELITRLRSRALDLPFESIGDVIELIGPACDFDKAERDDPHRWLLIQAGQYVDLPASGGGRYSFSVAPTELIAFETFPGPGCEPANFGLGRYPAFVEIDDPDRRGSKRRLRTKLSGWFWSSFCKTQYASGSNNGGVPNFLKCHLAVIRLLDHAKELGILDGVSDEGDFWEKRDVKALAREVGTWNEKIAAAFGELRDQWGDQLVAPITDYPDFERLEMKGSAAVKRA